MGIYSRLFIPISFLILAVSAFRYQLLVKTETENASVRYVTDASHLGQYLAGTLLPLAASQNNLAVKQTLDGALQLNSDIAAIRWDSPASHIEVLPGRHPAAAYPDWFRALTGLGDMRTDFTIPLRGGANGTLSLSYRPVVQLNWIWAIVVKQAGISAFNVAMIYLLLGLILAAHRKMLQRLAQATDRFKLGDHGVRMAPGGTVEARALAATFNNMAGEVENLVGSLQASQKQLGDQLTQTVQMQSAQQQMAWQNYHDVLTGLPNRAALATCFEQELFLARDRQRLLAVCLIDLDRFQDINDRYSPESGDEILKQVAGRLYANQSHYAARLGGDEFVILLPDQPDLAAIERAVGQLLENLSQPYQCDMLPLSMTTSIGVAVYSGEETSTETLLRHADHAVYQAKRTGRNKYHFFDPSLDQDVLTHHNRRTEIRLALMAGEFRLYYQPKVHMRAGQVIGMEALLRWQHPRRGMLGPLQFLPLVEQTDLIIDIGEWVLRQALRQMQRWSAAGRHWVVSVNIAARHFQQPDFVSRLETILAEFPEVPVNMLELEILESSALHDIEHVRRIMTACQALGITFALDDFGTGYSSMSYLKRLPANILKIDQSFVRNMLNDQDDLHLVSAVIGLAKSFSLTVIAEGVESTEHGTRLMQLGCDLAQGYGIARPMPADAVLQWAAQFVPAPEWQAALLKPA